MNRFFARSLRPTGSATSLKLLRGGLILLYAILAIVTTVALVIVSLHDYQATIKEAERSSLSLARSLDEHATRSFVSVEQSMQNIVENLNQYGGVDQANELQTHKVLQDKVKLTPQVRAIITIDSKGLIQSHGLEYPTRHVSLADRSYFLYHRQFQDSRPLIGNPILSRTDGKWLIPVTQRIKKNSNEFGGVILAGVEPQYFIQFYQSLKLAPGSHVHLLRSDGVILLSYPFDEAQIGRNLRDIDPLLFEQRRLQGSSVYPSTYNNTQLLTAFHTSQSILPLIILISTDRNTLLNRFMSDLITRALAGLSFVLIISCLLYLLLKQIRRVESIEERLHLTQFTVDEAPDIILWADYSGQICYANRATSTSTGYSADELLKLRFFDIFPQINQAQWQEFWNTLTVEKRLLYTTHQINLQHTQLPVEITFSQITFAEVAYLCATVRDISEQQNSERELRRHRDHLQDLVWERTAEIRSVLDASPLAIMLSVKGTIRLVNPAFEALFGYSTAEITDMPTDMLHASAQHFTAYNKPIREAIKSKGTFRGEMELYRRDTSSFWAMVYAKEMVAGDISKGLICVIEDVSASRIAAQALRQSERLKRTIIEGTADGFILIDSKSRIVDINQAFCQQLGLHRNTLIGKQPDELWPEHANSIFPAHLSSQQMQSNHVEEVSLPAADGKQRPFLVNSACIYDEHQHLEYAFAFLTNISKLKEVESNLLEAKEAAEAANMAKSIFLANMSHELRTPMHAILSFSEIGLSKVGTADSANLIRYFERIHSSGNRLLILLNDLLDMSRLEANKMRYSKMNFDLKTITKHASTELLTLLASKDIQLNLDAGAPPLMLFFDKARITQVIINLLSNAIKFSPNHTEIDIHFIEETRLSDGRAASGLSVRDHGPGIPEAELDLIFDKFIQSSRLNSHASGTGLGLAISRQIMTDHGGEINARNAEGGGAVISILLPLEPPDKA
ncbi:PAS domain S-box protein [Iodobacter fluviatilis]|uniref:histidine kinase n=1 Tax=Iodobacter fluviatilis TaxID=537 RepID=A0A377QA58_9NEIS|nr:PAS domain S-box protein [Iodobacter fluviatilis]TCU82395.1 PAS domain S-box-containing protein [Iodobacter fluviatilis]STQ91620.1 Non-motile and phage-resistance protein [Iodobacter fluviatilis]